MKSSIASRSTSKLQDPLLSLPKELVLQLFEDFESNQLLQTATINHQWRDAILSCPPLFYSLDVDDREDPAFHRDWQGLMDYEDEDRIAKKVAIKVTRKVLRLSQLAENRLKEVKMCFQSFLDDAFIDWQATNLSKVFQILELSSNSLKTLLLRLESIPTGADPWERPNLPLLTSNVDHVVRIVKHSRENFKALQCLGISAEVAISLGSQSKDKSKSVYISDSRDNEYCVKEDEMQELQLWNRRSTYSSLIEEISNFTEHGMGMLAIEATVEVSQSMFRKLRESKESLECLVFSGHTIKFDEVFNLAVDCPNLEALLLNDYTMNEQEERRFRVPSRSTYLTKLKHLEIEERGDSIIDLNDQFFKWIGGSGSLQSLKYFRHRFRHAEIIPSKVIRAFLLSCSSSLTSLDLEGLSFAPETSSDQIHLPNLEVLHIEGNLKLFNFFASASYGSLETLKLINWTPCENQEVNHSGVVEILRSCKSCLESISIGHHDPDPNRSSRSKVYQIASSKDDQGASLSLPILTSLSLDLDFETISTFYLSINYPDLKRVDLHRRWRPSQVSFSLKGNSDSEDEPDDNEEIDEEEADDEEEGE